MNRAQKTEKVGALHQSFQDAVMVVVTHQSGMTVAETTDLRRQMRAAGASYRVTKNRLARIALKGTEFESLDSLFTGPTAVAFGSDPVAAAKVAVDYARKSDKLVVIGGGLGPRQLDSAGVETLAKLPSLDELRAKLVGLLQTPATRVATVLQAPAGQVARVLKAHAEKETGQEETAA